MSDSTNKEKMNRCTYKVANIVANVNLNKKIDISLIEKKYDDVRYNTNKFPGCQIRFKNPECIVLLFKNGKMVVTGLKEIEHASIIVHRVIDKLNELDFEISTKPDLNIVNIVVSLNFWHNINLDFAALKIPSSIYEPEVFPGIIYKEKNPYNKVYLIFSSGKVVLTGIKNKNEIIPAIKDLGNLLKREGLLDSNLKEKQKEEIIPY